MVHMISALLFASIVVVMAVGVILGRSPLKGSCGGKGGPECICDEFERLKCEARDKLLQRNSE
jgi:hypothetical protein